MIALLLGCGVIESLKPAPVLNGRWTGQFDAEEMKIGGILPVEDHEVLLTLNMVESDGVVSGTGDVSNALGSVRRLAFASDPLPATLNGTLIDRDLVLTATTPEVGAPPVALAIVIDGVFHGDRIEATCRLTGSGTLSNPVACELVREVETTEGAGPR